MRNPADILFHRPSEPNHPDRVNADEPITMLEQRQTTERVSGKAKLGRYTCVDYSLQIPGEVDDDTLEIHVNGFGAAKPSYRGVRKASAEAGQISASISPARGTAAGDLVRPRSLFHAEEYESESVLAVMRDIEKRFGISDVKLRSHSMGGRAGVAVAEAAPEQVKHVTLVSAAGLEPHSLFTMATRLPHFVNNDIRPYMGMLYQEFHEPQVMIDFMRYILQNPLRTSVEALSICRADIRDRVRNLGARGIAVSIIDAQADSLLPNKTVQSTLGADVNHYSMHPNPLIGHLGPQTHPREMVDEYRLADQAVRTRLEQVS